MQCLWSLFFFNFSINNVDVSFHPYFALDGSDAAFYISRNKRNRNWIIRLQAGGSCVLFSECYERRNTAFGSSKYLPQFMTGTFLTSNDATINPTFHKWNKVYIPYCR